MFIVPDLAPVVHTKVIHSRNKTYTIKIIECGDLKGIPTDCLCWIVYNDGHESKSIPRLVQEVASALCEIPPLMPYSLVDSTIPPDKDHQHKLERWQTHSGDITVGCRDCGYIESVGQGAEHDKQRP